MNILSKGTALKYCHFDVRKLLYLQPSFRMPYPIRVQVHVGPWQAGDSVEPKQVHAGNISKKYNPEAVHEFSVLIEVCHQKLAYNLKLSTQIFETVKISIWRKNA